VTHYQTAKINFITSTAVDIIRSFYYIHGPWADEINFCCFIMSLNDGPYTLL